jgi:hypothetical protein
MRWFTSVSFYLGAIGAGLCYAPAAWGCPLCFGSSGPGVLHAYLVSAFFMIGLVWSMIGLMCFYVARTDSDGAQQEGAGTIPQAAGSIQDSPAAFDYRTLVTQVVPAGTGKDCKGP